MKRSTLILVGVLVLTLVAEVVSAHPRTCSGGGFHGGWGGSGNTTWNGGGGWNWGVRPSYLSQNYSWGGNYYGGGWSGGNYYQPTQSVVVIKPPKPRPNIAVTRWDDNDLIEFALNKFSFTRGLDRDGNQVIMTIVGKDFHGDTGALKKVKFKVRWVEFKIVKEKDGNERREAKNRDTTIKLKFDEFGRFTEFCD